MRRGEPGPGLSRFSGAGRAQGGGQARDRRGLQPVRDHAWVAESSAAQSPTRCALQRHRLRPRSQHHGHLRRDRGDDRDDAGGDQSGRRGDHLRAVLRELRPRRDPGRRDAALRGAARSGFFDRSRRAGGGIRAAHQGDRHQHSAQPDAARSSRAPSSRRSRRYASGTTRSRSPTRSTSTSSTAARGTSRSRACRGWPIGRSRSAGCRRPTRSPDGGWRTRSRARRLTRGDSQGARFSDGRRAASAAGSRARSRCGCRSRFMRT